LGDQNYRFLKISLLALIRVRSAILFGMDADKPSVENSREIRLRRGLNIVCA
jgi:hypothetical protein